ncbi:MAG: hypothetical protein J6S58_06555, partial [Lentisphaeria bacterium]|nr:hypothetical protein [Lentisphaeria bacterium]
MKLKQILPAKILIVTALLTGVLNSVPAATSSASPAKQTVFQQYEYHFEKDKGRRSLPAPWTQNKSRTFLPCGKVEVIDAIFRNHKKALRITSGKTESHVYTDPVPVKLGDVLKVDVTFRSPDGKSAAFFGIYDEFQAMRCQPISKGWDSRCAYFEIRNPKTRKIRFFVGGPKNSVIDYAYLSFRKLKDEEISTFSPGKNLKLWETRTKGINLAYRKKVTFFPAPNYILTKKGGTDPTDLTDGKVYRGTGMLHFQSEAAGWNRQYGKISFMVDLGSVRKVGKTVIRINGGRGSLSFPKQLTVWGSRDGKNFYRGQSLAKVGKLESYLSNFRDLYYLPEGSGNQDPTYIYPFELSLNADARFVVFQITPGHLSLYSDELVILQASSGAEKDPNYNRIYQQKPEELFHSNILLRSQMETFYIAEKEFYPNFLTLDCRKNELKGKFSFTVDLPAAVEYSHAASYPADIRKLVKKERRGSRVIYHFQSTLPLGQEMLQLARQYGFGPLFFRVTDARKVPEKERFVIFETFCDGKLEKSIRQNLAILKFPAMPALKRLNNSMWLSPRYMGDWPGFLSALRGAGINYLPIFPQWPDEVAILDQCLKQARAENHTKFRLFLCPVGRQDKKSDYYCATKSPVKTVCLAYRGELYRKMLDQITEYVRKYPSEYLTFDVESWEPETMNNSMNCPRCNALRMKMKMNWVRYFSWAQAEYLKPFKQAVLKGAALAKRTPPQIGFYALTAGNGIFRYRCKEGAVDFLGGFEVMYPGYTDEAQFSYYGRNAQHVQQYARSAYAVLKNPALSNPWISGGTGAYYGEPFHHRTKHHLLEAVFNGCGGVQIYSFRSFGSPLDYYYFAEALRQIAPFEDLLMEGTLDFNFTISNKKLCCTKRDWKGKSLILVGNYEAVSRAETLLPLKGRVT